MSNDATDSANLQTLARIETFLIQSQKLLALAKEGKWDEFEVLMDERQRGLAALGEGAFLIQVAREGLAVEAKAMINAIKHIDENILSIAEHSKTEIGDKLRQSFQASKAIGAYKS